MHFFVSCILWVKECNQITTNCVTLTRDLVGQGHAWLQVTFPISGSIHARSMNFFCFLHSTGQRMQRNNNQQRNLDAWPLSSRSRVVTSSLTFSFVTTTKCDYAEQIYLSVKWMIWNVEHKMEANLHNQNCVVQKIHRFSMYTTRDRKGHLLPRVTLTYKVTRQSYGVGCYFFAFLDP